MDRLRREDPDGDSARAAMGAARCSRLSPAVPTVPTVDPEETAGAVEDMESVQRILIDRVGSVWVWTALGNGERRVACGQTWTLLRCLNTITSIMSGEAEKAFYDR